MSTAPLVENAADVRQVRYGRQATKSGRKREMEELRGLLEIRAARALLWRFLDHSGLFAQAGVVSGEMLQRETGMRDMGHYILSEIQEADPEALFAMMREARQRDQDEGETARNVRKQQERESEDG